MMNATPPAFNVPAMGDQNTQMLGPPAGQGGSQSGWYQPPTPLQPPDSQSGWWQPPTPLAPPPPPSSPDGGQYLPNNIPMQPPANPDGGQYSENWHPMWPPANSAGAPSTPTQPPTPPTGPWTPAPQMSPLPAQTQPTGPWMAPPPPPQQPNNTNDQSFIRGPWNYKSSFTGNPFGSPADNMADALKNGSGWNWTG